jgi:parallel beta-helix repeat protein
MKRYKKLNISFRVMMAIFFILIAIPPFGAEAAGTTYYVDNTTSCSDIGPGTLASPFCTIQKGADNAGAGDSVYVLNGTYAETVYPLSGSAGNPVTFQADPGVTVMGDSSGFGSAFAVEGLSYVVIDGFNITNTKFKGIYVADSDHITISNNHVSYAGLVTPSTIAEEQGIYLKNTTYSTITSNTTDHNTCIGIRLVNTSDYNEVSNNISYANASVDSIESDAAGIELTGSSHNTIINNITYANEDSGINSYPNSSGVFSSYNLIIGNLSYGNGDHGIDNNNAPYNTVVGNTVHGNGTVGINFEGDIGLGSHHATVANNISVANGLTPPTLSFGGNLRIDSQSINGTILDYNLFDREGATVQIIWFDTPYASLADFQAAAPGQEVHGLEGDPLFVDPVAPVLRDDVIPYTIPLNVGDYHLSSGSPAIDSANSDAPSEPLLDIEGNPRVDDPSITNTGAGTRAYDDRGAYEFQLGGIGAPTVTTQAVTNITQSSATGNGNITSLGTPNPTEHGVVWSTSANPTTADSKTTDGPVSATGAFTSNITALAPGTLYHVRAYATNTAGTSYGDDVSFTTLPADTETFNTSGSWVAPANVTSVTVEVWGGGGKGGSITSGYGEDEGGGGGGGAYSKKANIPVTPGNSYSYVVGAGSTSESPGGDSYFIDTSTVLAKGGYSVLNNSSNGANGGLAASGVGDTRYSGGNGAGGSSSNNRGGGGGSSAGTDANGTNATNQNGAKRRW